MEARMQTQSQQRQHNKATMKKSLSRNSESSSTHMDSPHSPLGFHSPMRSELGDLPETPPFVSPENSQGKPAENSKAIVAFDRFTQYSPLPSPGDRQKRLESTKPVMGISRARREDLPPSVTKVGPIAGEEVQRSEPVMSTPWGRKTKREEMVRRAALGFRLSEMVLCLVSFSVMAADKTQGWSGDSFDRYKEYRYCLSVNVIAFVYSGFQAYALTHHLITGKPLIRHRHRHHFDFFMDQILAYLLISASSSAATRVDDWQSNWGKDQFTKMASASVGMAFLAFVAFAFSSLISGYNLCTPESI
ncbi:CASP-like protein 4A3 [Alnus glutinosa]|uniref:CASP-like protein 4A3 n=1 Tax=Alnus glutinosa TaxID=3517 RepID=UPI002D76EE45|nr:CASP-like protein 4A3 [Alnus glutinosa]